MIFLVIMSSNGAVDAVRPRMDLAGEVDDPLLADLDRAEAHRGPAPLEDFRGAAEPPPYDVEVARPVVLDLRRLYALAGKPLPSVAQATLGPSRLLLVCHGVTPFHRPGARPSSIWGLGYESRLDDANGDTIAFCPNSKTHSVGVVEQSVKVGVGAGGELDVPREALEIVGTLPGVTITGAELGVTTHTRLALALSLSLTLRAVEAGPVGAGGVRWNIYQTTERLDCYQPLFQTLLVGTSETVLNFGIRTWVRSRGFLGLGAKQWISDWVKFTVPLKAGV